MFYVSFKLRLITNFFVLIQAKTKIEQFICMSVTQTTPTLLRQPSLKNNKVNNQNPAKQGGESPNNSNTKIVIWGSNLESGLGVGRITKNIAAMYGLPSLQYSVIVGLLLSDAWLHKNTPAKNVIKPRGNSTRLGFLQSYDKFEYFFSVYSYLSHYCSTIPNLKIRIRTVNLLYSLTFQTRNLPCLDNLLELFYKNGVKVIPAAQDIYNLLDPIALTH
jgi:hypothetical protein